MNTGSRNINLTPFSFLRAGAQRDRRHCARLVAIMSIVSLINGCSAVDVLNAITPSGRHELTSGIAYGSDPRQRLDVYRPKPSGSARPLVVFFYGGSWNRGDRGDYRFVGQALAARGMVVVVPDYRVYLGGLSRILHDSAAAVAWRCATRLRRCPERLYVMGHSAGAYNVAARLDLRWFEQHGLSP